jgi:hypothetical protein
MTREEAARDIDNTACCFSDKQFRDAMHMAADALRGPHPDPITGLVPCGCGGVARVAVQYAYPDERRVFCERCGLTTIWLSAPMSVLQFHWNRAMGMLEVEG